MPGYDACLIDVFETVLSVDHLQHGARLAERAGVDPEAFAAATGRWGPIVTDGRATLAEALAGVLRDCGAEPDDGFVERLVTADREEILDLAVLHDDTVPFLEALRAAGVRTAFVSNCAENTRPVLDALGLTDLVDELVLSCEVGSAKPEPEIFRAALDRLGVPAARAVLVDDQATYCDGARALGMAAVRIDRRGGTGDVDTLSALTGRLIGRL
ncbi:MAG TPA: HAD-IA family hydrolase [Nocardioides sp.]|nr:HAD-IA family hydrolase [Nocardioides sp.]